MYDSHANAYVWHAQKYIQVNAILNKINDWEIGLLGLVFTSLCHSPFLDSFPNPNSRVLCPLNSQIVSISLLPKGFSRELPVTAKGSKIESHIKFQVTITNCTEKIPAQVT